MKYFVYILLCSDNSYYTGVTNNLKYRLYQHENGLDKACYTNSRRPLKLEYSQEFKNVNEAISAEKRIKKWTRKKKEALIRGQFDLLIELAKCKNGTYLKRDI